MECGVNLPPAPCIERGFANALSNTSDYGADMRTKIALIILATLIVASQSLAQGYSWSIQQYLNAPPDMQRWYLLGVFEGAGLKSLPGEILLPPLQPDPGYSGPYIAGEYDGTSYVTSDRSVSVTVIPHLVRCLRRKFENFNISHMASLHVMINREIAPHADRSPNAAAVAMIIGALESICARSP